MAERRIGDRVFKVVPLPASEALLLYGETLRIAGFGAGRLPALLMSADGSDESSPLKDIALLLALSDVLNGAGTSAIRDLIKRLVELAMVQRPGGSYEQVDLDHDFTGHLGDIIPVVKFALAEQFSDFFIASGANGILGTLRTALASTK